MAKRGSQIAVSEPLGLGEILGCYSRRDLGGKSFFVRHHVVGELAVRRLRLNQNSVRVRQGSVGVCGTRDSNMRISMATAEVERTLRIDRLPQSLKGDYNAILPGRALGNRAIDGVARVVFISRNTHEELLLSAEAERLDPAGHFPGLTGHRDA